MTGGRRRSAVAMSLPETKLDRKTIEKNRRIHMKELCFKLASLIPPHYLKHESSSSSSSYKEFPSQLDQLDIAATYIKELRDRIDELKWKKKLAMDDNRPWISNNVIDETKMTSTHKLLPIVELRDLGSSLEVVLISGVHKNFTMFEVISVLEEEGAEVLSASFCTMGDKVFHSLHAQAKISRVGVETTRVWQRLQELIHN